MIKGVLQKAFSIIELLLVLVFLGIMTFIVIPDWGGFLKKNRALTYANELRSILQFARMSAIKLGEQVAFCGSKNGESCDGLWGDGQIIFIGSHESSFDSILRVLPGVFGDDRLIWKGSSPVKDTLIFHPDGLLNKQRGSFYYLPNNSLDHAIRVVLEKTGRIRIEWVNPDIS